MTPTELPPRFDRVLDEAEPLANLFRAAGYRLYLVGGVVRDNLLGIDREEQDLDATTDARPAEIKRIVAAIADAVWTQGERFGTIGCRIGNRPYEITTHRAEVYDKESRKPVVSFGDRIDDDLARRDFTVNAMAVDLETRRLIDPHGGSDDLRNGLLRTPLDPSVSFSDDPLRMLRAARFRAGYDLTPAPELLAAIADMVDRIGIVSGERVREELQKLLLLAQVESGLRMLHDTSLLGRLFAVFDGLTDEELERLGRRVGAAASRPAQRWAALFFDCADVVAAVRPLKPSRALVGEISWLVGGRSWADDGVPEDPPSLREAAATSPSGCRLEDLLDLVEAVRLADGRTVGDIADARAVLAELRRTEPDLDAPLPALSGGEICDLLAIDPGPEVGRAMKWLAAQRVARGPLRREAAEQALESWWSASSAGE